MHTITLSDYVVYGAEYRVVWYTTYNALGHVVPRMRGNGVYPMYTIQHHV